MATYVARLEDMGQCNWGYAALSWLYRCMCCVANRNVVKLAGPLQVLQSWIFWRFPGFWPNEFDVFHWPLMVKLSAELERQGASCRELEFLWMPYSLVEVIQVVHPEILESPHMTLWRAAIALIYFAVIEWHPVDRVLPLFGGVQDNRRVARRQRVGTRSSQREWIWLEEAIDAMEGRGHGRRGGRGHGLCGGGGRGRGRARRCHRGGGGGGVSGLGGVGVSGGDGGRVGGGSADGADIPGCGFGDYFARVPTCDDSLQEHQTYISPGQMWSDLLGSEGLEAEFGASHFLDEISMIMQEDELAISHAGTLDEVL
ncbi:hypothetical protein Ahy_B07g086323 [Arachis hypogaea]|uniref:Aminotransferase-like plant mobile domain-containing protein n=1 Tax=Arachis hypogaea TaxID=3818 RepID=A0A444Y9F4_ARAHY|nr:hypothetical protein Ahy_B07g086323 [Arachis hypogaea]